MTQDQDRAAERFRNYTDALPRQPHRKPLWSWALRGTGYLMWGIGIVLIKIGLLACLPGAIICFVGAWLKVRAYKVWSLQDFSGPMPPTPPPSPRTELRHQHWSDQ